VRDERGLLQYGAVHRRVLSGRHPVVALLVVAGCHRGAAPHNRQLAAGHFTGCLLHDGHVTCWPVGRTSPDDITGPIEGVDDAVQLSVGLSTSCVVRTDHTVACWGIDWTAAPGSPQPVRRAVEVAKLDGVVQISVGRSHVCAVRSTGEVDCWGDNFRGQLGLAGSYEARKPSPVAGITDAVEVSCGDDHTCVRHRDGTVSCFGTMDPGLHASQAMRTIDGLHDITALASGAQFTCGITRGGEAWCAGHNSLAELGGGDHDPHTDVVRVRGLEHVAQISASGPHACARTDGGEVWCWGSEFGHGIMPARTDDVDKGPLRTTGLAKANEIAVGEQQACALVDGGGVWCWGPAPAAERGQAVPAQRTVE